jgi:hypothetical protein
MASSYQPLTGEQPDVLIQPIASDPAPATAQAPLESRHIFVCFFHLFFRGAALIMYLFGTLFSALQENFVIVFIVIVLLLAADFWTVKNVSGRKLVGLRWWNDVRDDGTSEWRFESIKVRSSRGVHALV